MKKSLIILSIIIFIGLFFPQPVSASTLSGNYDTLTLSTSGTASNPNVFTGDGTAVIKCLKMLGDYITVSNVTVTGCSSHAAFIQGKNDIFENSRVYHSVTENNGTSQGTCSGSGSWGSAVKAENGSENAIIRGNEVYENCGEGIGITMSKNALVENNIVRDNFSVNIYLDNSPFATARNNNVTCTGSYLRNGKRMSGVVISEENYDYWDPNWGRQRHDITVDGNIINGCDTGVSSWNSYFTGSTFINGTITNNTITNGQSGSIYIQSFSNYASNQNVLVVSNNVYRDPYVDNPSGITLQNNMIITNGTPLPTINPTVSPTTAPTNQPTSAPTTAPTTAPTDSPTPTGSPVTILGDVNNDGRVNIVDIGIVIDNYAQSPLTDLRADLNNDGIINIVDIGIIIDNYI